MRLLVIDPDRHLSEIVQSVMTGEGHEVILAATGEQALRAFQATPADLILGLMELEGEDGVDVLRRIRSATNGNQAELILMSNYRRRYDRQVQDAMSDLNARDFMRHPFSVLDLVDMLRRLEPRREASPERLATPPESLSLQPLPHGRYSSRNLNTLARLWSSSASGILHVDKAPGVASGGVSGWVTLQNGGPAHSNDWELIRALLQGGEMTFERAAIEGSGDHTGLGRLLYFAVFDEAKTDFGERHRFEAMLCTEPLAAIASLPISEPTLTLLRSANGSESIGVLLARSGGDAGMISAELWALRQLQMIVLQTPLARTSGTGSSIKRARQKVDGESGKPLWTTPTPRTPGPDTPNWMSNEPSVDDSFVPSRLDDTVVDVPMAPVWLSNDDASLGTNNQTGWLDDTSDWSNSVWTQNAPESSWLDVSDTIGEHAAPDLPDWMQDSKPTTPAGGESPIKQANLSSRPPGERSARRTSRNRMTDELRERRVGHWRRRRPARTPSKKLSPKRNRSEEMTQTDIRHRRLQDPETLRRIFTQELTRLRSALPAVVLGVPADAEVTLITQSARRLRHRYKVIADDRRMPEDVRLQAEELKSLVYAAHKTLKRGEAPVVSTSVDDRMDDVEWLLQEGRRMIGAGNWSQADRVLSRAHRIRIDHPEVLSSLGWARLHNPNRPVPAREEEAQDLLGLALQFDPGASNIRYYLAEVLVARNDLEAAMQHATEGARLSPDHPELSALIGRLQAKLDRP